ncbi:MAG: hypothetical protein DRP09_05540 [Candidatus Thorarchaeota archaeon]|nr:MAG: hypothetical protein DRP09_05540 [Candidatus Thorarchaeota archaeon]
MVAAFMLSSVAAPVAAYQTNLVTEYYNDAFPGGTNNHTYMYVPHDPTRAVSGGWIHANEDLNCLTYRYDNSGWSRSSSVFNAPSDNLVIWDSHSSKARGTYGDTLLMPVFYDFTGPSGEPVVVNTTVERRMFPLPVGQHTPVVVDDSGFLYIGAMTITGEEFIHLIVDSRQDDVLWHVWVVDPEGRFMGEANQADGDIWAIPFKPSGPGVYRVYLMVDISVGNTAIFDFYPQPVTPERIAFGEVVTGILPTGELVMREDTGSWIHQELVPTIRTYRIDSPEHAASVSYTFNYPEMFIGITQPTTLIFQSSDFLHWYGNGMRYGDGQTMPDNGNLYYRGSEHYVTVMGGDGVEYTLYHQVEDTELPLNQEFRLDNEFSSPATYAYELDLDEDSVLRVNASTPNYSVRMVGYYDDGYVVPLDIGYGPSLWLTSEEVLPAGKYVFVVDVDPFTKGSFIEFNLGPFVDDTQDDIARVGGFIVDTDSFNFYNLTFQLNNPDNVTVFFGMSVYDQFGTTITSATFTLANWFDGSSIIPHSTYDNEITYQDINGMSNDFAYVAITIASVANNTAGATNYYADYPVDCSIEVTNSMASVHEEIGSADARTTADSYNFSLSVLGAASEMYGLRVNTTPGMWYNVSVKTSDVSSFTAYAIFDYGDIGFTVPWSDLDDTYTGSVSDMSFQFGAISEDTFLSLLLTRALSDDGFLWIELTPIETHQLSSVGPLPSSGDLFSMLGGIALPAAGAGIVIVVVTVLYFKKFKK